MSCAHEVAATNSASVTDNVTLCCILLLVTTRSIAEFKGRIWSVRRTATNDTRGTRKRSFDGRRHVIYYESIGIYWTEGQEAYDTRG